MATLALHPLLSLPMREPARLICDCGAASVVDLVSVVDTVDDPALLELAIDDALNTRECPHCGATMQAQRPVVILDAARSVVYLLLGRGQRHEGIRALSNFFAELADAPQDGDLPGFVMRPSLVFGGAGLASVMANAAAAAATEPEPELEPEPEPEPEPGLEGDSRPAPLAAEQAQAWDDSLDGEWFLGQPKRPGTTPEDASPKEARDEREPTVRFDLAEGSERGSAKDVEVLGPEPAAGPFEAFDEQRGDGGDHYWVVREDHLYLCVRDDDESLDTLLAKPLELRFQLHRPEEGAVAALTLISGRGERSHVECLWAFDPSDEAHRAALAALADEFRPRVVLFGRDARPRRQLPFPEGAEDNVRFGLKIADAWNATGERAGFAAATEAIQSAEWSLLGDKVHPFGGDALAHLLDAVRTRFAVNIVEYWVDDDNAAYLLLTKSFPVPEFDEIVARTVEAAAAFGIALGPRLTQQALRSDLAETEPDLLLGQLAAFAEVSLHLKPSGLDEVSEWENWDALLDRAERTGVTVDPSILGLAEGAMERVKRLLTEGEAPGAPEASASPGDMRTATPPPPPPQSAADPGLPPGMRRSGVTEEIDPDEDDDVFLEDRAEDGDLADLSGKQLVALLDEAPRSAEAAIAIMGRGEREVADALTARVRGDEGPGRTRSLECLASLGDVAVAAVLEGVKSRRRGDESLDDAVAILVRAVGKDRVERLKRDRSRKVRDAVRRVLERLSASETDPAIREQEAVANAFMATGGAPTPTSTEDAIS